MAVGEAKMRKKRVEKEDEGDDVDDNDNDDDDEKEEWEGSRRMGQTCDANKERLRSRKYVQHKNADAENEEKSGRRYGSEERGIGQQGQRRRKRRC